MDTNSQLYRFDMSGNRRRHLELNEEDIDAIAEKAAEKALIKMETKIYQQVGKTFVNRLFQFLGVVVVGIALYLNSKGFLHIKGG